jgi:hypothetical protein
MSNMNYTNIAFLILTILCVSIGGYMAIKDMSNWGWFLFFAFIFATGISSGNSETEDEDDE